MSSKFPLAKIDRTNKVSLQNIHIFFSQNVPKAKTLIYSFPHGYKYTPTLWSLVQCIGVTTPYTANPYIMDNGTILFTAGVGYCSLSIEADATNVYFYTTRPYDTLITNNTYNVTVAGVGLRIRTYVFVEDVGI
jgi:hypothetical protein